MPLPSSGTISLNDVRNVLAITTGSISLGELRNGSSPSWLKAPSLEGYNGNLKHLGSRIYFGLGVSTPGTNLNATVSRLLTSNNTVSVLNFTLVNRRYMASIRSSTTGFFCGGFSTKSTFSSIYSMEFLTESANTGSLGLLASRRLSTGLSTSTAGYIFGGITTSTTNTIERFTFSTLTAASVSATISEGVYGLASVTTSTKGYLGGGYLASSQVTAKIEGFLYSTEATGVISGTTLAAGRSLLASCSSSTKGYFLGGSTTNSTSNPTGEVDGILYSTESQVNPSATITAATYPAGGESSTTGYIAGGLTGSGLSLGVISTLNFATEVTSYILNSGLMSNKYGSAAISYQEVLDPSISLDNCHYYNPQCGYIIGGSTSSGSTSAIERFVLATEGTQVAGASLQSATTNLTANSYAQNIYSAGGIISGSNTAVISKMSAVTETLATLTQALVLARQSLCSVAPFSYTLTTSKIFFISGLAGTYTTEIESITASTDSITDETISLSPAREGIAGLRSYNRGYLAGGYNGSYSTNITVITFNSITPATLSSSLGSRSYAQTFSGFRLGNSIGYITGGFNSGGYSSSTETINFISNAYGGTSTSLSTGRAAGGGISGTLKGYIIGGEAASGLLSNSESFTYSSASWASNSASLSSAKSYFGCTEVTN